MVNLWWICVNFVWILCWFLCWSVWILCVCVDLSAVLNAPPNPDPPAHLPLQCRAGRAATLSGGRRARSKWRVACIGGKFWFQFFLSILAESLVGGKLLISFFAAQFFRCCSVVGAVINLDLTPMTMKRHQWKNLQARMIPIARKRHHWNISCFGEKYAKIWELSNQPAFLRYNKRARPVSVSSSAGNDSGGGASCVGEKNFGGQ